LANSALRVRRSNSLQRRPKQRVRIGSDLTFLGHNLIKRIGGWAKSRLLLLVALAALLWLGSHMANAPEFRITEVKLKGSDLVKPDELFRLASLQNQPIILVNRKQVEESVKTLRAIEAASVQLEFPNRAIIEVMERKPAYVWKVKETLYLVSDDGIVVGTSGAVDRSVAVVDIDGKDVAIGDAVDEHALRTARKLRDLLTAALSYTPAYFEYSQAEGIVLPTDFGGRVVFGTGEDIEMKVATLKSLRQTFQEQKLKASYVDLRFKDRPYFR
jgi:cell division septal protein FtsQ